MTDLFFRAECDRVGEMERCRVELARRQAAAPLRPKVRQETCDIGLFSDAANQTDLVDAAKARERMPPRIGGGSHKT